MEVSDQVFLEEYITTGCATGSCTGVCMAHLTGLGCATGSCRGVCMAHLTGYSLCTADATESSTDIHVGNGAVLYRCAHIFSVTGSI